MSVPFWISDQWLTCRISNQPRPLQMLKSHQKKIYYAMGIDTLSKLNKIKLKWRNEKKIFPYNKCVLLNRKCQWTMRAIEILFIHHWNCVMIIFAIIHLLEYVLVFVWNLCIYSNWKGQLIFFPYLVKEFTM